jgi:hypothetical protein
MKKLIYLFDNKKSNYEKVNVFIGFDGNADRMDSL